MAFRTKLTQILSIRESPHRIALAFSVGIFIGMSPLLGIHTLLGIAVAWQFRLNKLVTLVGVYVTNPWTIIPIYTFGTWMGAKLLGVRHILPDIDWSHITLMGFISDFRHLLMPFVVGTTFIGTISALAGYALIYHSVKKARG
ncbi:MAG: DUF2062 domain-containing protein [Nitrospiraceae bacterium]|nr:DUF2062 domain-containing protein [Nitrospiraceae bacterium]